MDEKKHNPEEMSLKQLKIEIQNLESELAFVLSKFTGLTELTVTYIDIDYDEPNSYAVYNKVRVDAKVNTNED